MDTLQDIMSSPVVTAPPDTSVSASLAIMEEHNISALVVAENNSPLGIFTERTLIETSAHEEFDYSWPIQKVMSSPPVTVSCEVDYREAYQLFIRHNIRHLIVVEDESQVVGIVTETDFLNHLGLEYFMEFMSVDQIMSRDLVTVPPGTLASMARKLMSDHRISSLVVEEDGLPVGILTERDLLRLIRRNHNLEATQVEQVMTSPVHTIFTDTSTHSAAQILKENVFRRLVVTRSNGRCAGIITETDIIKGLRSRYTDYLKNIIQKQAQQLQEARELIDEKSVLESMLQSSGDIAIAIFDLGFSLLQQNEAASKYFGLKANSHNGSISVLTGQAENAVLFKAAIRQAKRDGKHEFILEQRSGDDIRHLAVSLFCIYDQTVAIVGFGLIALDISTQKKNEQSLLAERDFSKKIIEKTPAIICSIAPDGIIQFINPAGLSLTGYSSGELEGQKWQDYFCDKESGNKSDRLLKKLLQEDRRDYEVRMITKNKEDRDIAWNTVRRFNEKGNFFETLLVGNDVTDRKRAMHELSEKRKELQEANIALKVMLEQHTRAKEKIEEDFTVKLKQLVGPYLDLLRQSSLTDEQLETVEMISAHIDSMTDSFSMKAKEVLLSLSPREALIADMVRHGKSSKDISEILHISYRTVETYRNNLRKKLGIKNKKISLRTYLQAENKN